jgi:hypothetical protein
LLAFRSILQNAALFKLLGTMSPPREKPTVFPAAQDAAAR